jgi:hypothetical protein
MTCSEFLLAAPRFMSAQSKLPPAPALQIRHGRKCATRAFTTQIARMAIGAILFEPKTCERETLGHVCVGLKLPKTTVRALKHVHRQR